MFQSVRSSYQWILVSNVSIRKKFLSVEFSNVSIRKKAYQWILFLMQTNPQILRKLMAKIIFMHYGKEFHCLRLVCA